MKKCPKCETLADFKPDEDFVFSCTCGFKWRATLECPACGGEAARKKDGYHCISRGCGLSHWTPTSEVTEEDFKVMFGDGWNKLAYLPDEDLCFLCNAPVLKQGDSSKCQNQVCDMFEQRVHTYRITDASCNPAGDLTGQKDGGKKLLNQIGGLVSRSSRKLLYETPHERYRNTCSLIDQLRFLRMRLPQPTHLTETVDRIIKHVKDTSPFHQ